MPAKNTGETLDRAAGAQEIAAQRLKNGRMNGVILESAEVVRGMETAARGLFINAEITPDGKLVGKYLTLPE